MSRIEIVLPPAASPYDEATILSACQQQTTMAGHGEDYVGRPATALIDTGEAVLKLRTEYQLPLSQARRFITQAIERERLLAVHHPHKTWFLWLPEGDDGPAVIGNITPQLLALNRREPLFAEHDVAAVTALIGQMFERYLAVFVQHELSLDLCLSNFAIDAAGRLHYLDDEVYPGSNLNILSDALGNLIRAQEWLDESAARALGESLRESLSRHFADRHWITVVAEDLRATFIPPQREAVSRALVEALYAEQRFSYAAPQVQEGAVLALIGDIHGNAPALECALDYLAGRGIDSGVMLGDVVGYGPHPQQCVDMLRSLTGWSMIRGNHDHAAACGELRSGMTALASWSLRWTIGQLDESARAWLAQLPVYQQAEQWLAVHGAPVDKSFFNGYVYQMSYRENLDELAERQIPLCFHGHTHIQKTWLRDPRGDTGDVAAQQQLSGAAHVLISPGSIGQPRGGEPGVELAVIDLQTRALEYIRLPYDMEATLADMAVLQFPPEMMDRLRRGQ